MSMHTFFCDDNKRPATVEVRPIQGRENVIVVAMSVPDASINLHMDDMAAAYKLYERLGNALQAARDAQEEASCGIDLSAGAPHDGGTIGIQPGNPTMDAHGPRQTRDHEDALVHSVDPRILDPDPRHWRK